MNKKEILKYLKEVRDERIEQYDDYGSLKEEVKDVLGKKTITRKEIQEFMENWGDANEWENAHYTAGGVAVLDQAIKAIESN